MRKNPKALRRNTLGSLTADDDMLLSTILRFALFSDVILNNKSENSARVLKGFKLNEWL